MQFTDDMEKQATELRRSNAAHERELKAQRAAVHASLKEVIESSAASMTMSSLVNAVVEEGTTRELRNEQLAAEERLKKAVAALGAELRERLEANEARLQADHAKREQLLQDAEIRADVDETVQRLVDAVESMEAAETQELTSMQMRALLETVMAQRSEAEEAAASAAAAAKARELATEAQLARLAIRIDAVSNAQQEALSKAREGVSGDAVAREEALQLRLEELQATVERLQQQAREMRAEDQLLAGRNKEDVVRVSAELSGLKQGLGLAGMAAPLAKAEDLKELERKVEAQISRATASLQETQQLFTRASARMEQMADAAELRAEKARQEAEQRQAMLKVEQMELTRAQNDERARLAAQNAAERQGQTPQAVAGRENEVASSREADQSTPHAGFDPSLSEMTTSPAKKTL